MKIETKFNMGETVYTVTKPVENKKWEILTGIIASAKIFISNGSIEIKYYIECAFPQFYDDYYKQDVLFATKEEAEQKLKELEQ